ncbi:leucine-rich repeat-containing protein 15-like [Branchiostoma floridae]|uniref:Leucine-rich repeat-containing protein 15-like n=1 Tax=Branchiostoma floridae TaxID=7739 RepID=A0A9J7KYR1_BRAFL|nr:leucine-rich repeat-containing protein 15-like [Branchiostoma floridae]
MAKFLLSCIIAICCASLSIAMDSASNSYSQPTTSEILVGKGPGWECKYTTMPPYMYNCGCTRISELRLADVNFFDNTVTDLWVPCNAKLPSYNASVFDGLPSFIRQIKIWDCFEEEVGKEVLYGLINIDSLDLVNMLSLFVNRVLDHWITEPLAPVRLDPELFASVPQLRKLNLRWLFMDTFPEALYHKINGQAPLQNMLELDLSWNRIPDVKSEYFSNMIKLNVLDISFNHIHNLSDSLLMLRNLQRLHIKGNHIESLDGSPFKTLRELSTLVLSQMRPIINITLPGHVGHKYPQRGALRFIHPSSFVGLWNLKELQIDINSIELIQNGTFDPLIKLEQLNLSVGLISTIEEDGFRGLQSLSSLDLSYNNLSCIGNSVFENLPALLKLNLEGNYPREPL